MRKAKSDYYKTGQRVLIGGCPVRLAIPMSAHAVSIMREGCTRERFSQDEMAIAYAKAILTQRSISWPDEGRNCKAVVHHDLPSGMDWSKKNYRAKSVVWEIGSYTGSRWDWRGERWEASGEAFRFDIPHWDHVPTVNDCSQFEMAEAA